MNDLSMQAQPAAARTSRRAPPMRHVEIAWLGPDRRPEWRSVTIPALAEFECAFNAFTRGTYLQTPSGPRAIEDLQPGQMLTTEAHGPQPILWIGQMRMVPDAPLDRPELGQITRILPDAFGTERPQANPLLGPGARLVDPHAPANPLTPARLIQDGLLALEIRPHHPIEFFHIQLPRHALIRDANMSVESFHPGEGIFETMGTNAQMFLLTLFPHLESLHDFGSLSCPRLSLWADRFTAAA